MMGVHVFINSTVMSNDSIHSILTWEKANEKVKPNVVYPKWPSCFRGGGPLRRAISDKPL